MASSNNDVLNEINPKPETVKQRFKRLLNFHSDLVDVHFIIGNNENEEKVPAHKFPLTIGSEVFKTMFCGSLPMKPDEVELPDVELEGFLTLLHFLYFKEVELTSIQSALDTLYVAKKYIVLELENHCIEYLKKTLTCKNAVVLLTKAQFYNNSELEAACLNVIDTNTMEVLDSDDFIDIDLETLILILKRDTLQVMELELFKAIVKWSKNECVRKQLEITLENQQNVLGEAINLIRFDLMTLKDFISGPIQSGLLSYEKVQRFSLELVSEEKYVRCVENSFRSFPVYRIEEYLKFNSDNGIEVDYGSVFKQSFKVTKPKLCIVGLTVSTNYEYKLLHFCLYINNDLCINDNMFKMTDSDDCDETTITFNSPIILTCNDEFKVKLHFTANDDSGMYLTKRSKCNGNETINMDDYFKWGEEQGEYNFISEIRFFE